MPNKYPEKKGWDVPKQKYKIKNWSEYNKGPGSFLGYTLADAATAE